MEGLEKMYCPIKQDVCRGYCVFYCCESETCMVMVNQLRKTQQLEKISSSLKNIDERMEQLSRMLGNKTIK